MIILKKIRRTLLQFTKKAPSRKGLHILLGVIVLSAIYLLSVAIGGFVAIAFPPALIGIVLLFTLLMALRRVPVVIADSSGVLLRHMSLFFLPAIVAIVNYKTLIAQYPLAMLMAVVISTIFSLGVTGVVANALLKKLNPEQSKLNSKNET